jgi:hypothetical protein
MKNKKRENQRFSKAKFKDEFNKMREYKRENHGSEEEIQDTEDQLGRLIGKTLYLENELNRLDKLISD